MQEKKFKESERKTARETSKIVRIMQTDIPGEKQTYIGLTKIKGVAFSISNATCHKLKIPKNKKVEDLSEEEIKKIEKFIQNPSLPSFLLNRRKDLETGEDKHLITTDLDLRKDFDVKRLKKIRSYRGLRHATGQPTRGQRTKSHFRQKGKSMGVIKKAKVGKKS